MSKSGELVRSASPSPARQLFFRSTEQYWTCTLLGLFCVGIHCDEYAPAPCRSGGPHWPPRVDPGSRNQAKRSLTEPKDEKKAPKKEQKAPAPARGKTAPYARLGHGARGSAHLTPTSHRPPTGCWQTTEDHRHRRRRPLSLLWSACLALPCPVRYFCAINLHLGLKLCH